MWESNPRYTSAQLYDTGETNLTREKVEENGEGWWFGDSILHWGGMNSVPIEDMSIFTPVLWHG